MISDVEHLFMYLFDHLCVFFGKMSIPILCPFVNWIVWGFFLLSCMSSLYNLDINPLSDIQFANIFFYSVDSLFILLMVSFAVQKLFSLI